MNDKASYSSRLSFYSLVAYLLSATGWNHYSFAEQSVTFNSKFLRSNIDITKFSKGNPVLPGEYLVDLYVNNTFKDSLKIKFSKVQGSDIAVPCFNMEQYEILEVDTLKLNKYQLNNLRTNNCQPISNLFSEASSDYDSSTQKLNVNIAQAYLLHKARGYVSPRLWDNGITSAILEYDYNGYRSQSSGSNDLSTQYLSLNGGLNVGAWRLRYRSVLNWATGSKWSYDNSSTYLERGLDSILSKIVIGQSNTDGQVFNSVGFEGAMLTSDDRMYMDSQRGYAPVINGVADTNAVVTVTQLGARIYETTVPPGPFTINDLYPTGTGGDLIVTVKEADGRKRSFTVSYATIPELLRPGTTRYSLMSGRYHNTSVSAKPIIAMGTLRHGFTNTLTGYSGLLGGEYYKSLSAGIALNTVLGAFSSDYTYAKSTLYSNSSREGGSIKFSFAKIIPVTNTNVTLANYRYSSSGYYNIDDLMLLRDASKNGTNGYYSNSINTKNRSQISASQTLPEGFGVMSLSASKQNYWKRTGNDTEYQIGYTNSFKKFNININASRTRDIVRDAWDTKFAVGISLPLGSGENPAYLNSTYVQEKDHYGMQNSVAGILGDRRQYNYSGFANVDHYKESGSQNSAGVSGNWNSRYTNLGGSYSTGSGYKQYGVNLSGGVIGYSNGIVFTPTMGDTMAIIEANNASGAMVSNNSSITLDKSGKAAVPYLTPYRQNVIEIDPKGLSTDVSLDVTSRRTVPTSGAVVLIKYKTEKGYSAILNITDKKNQTIPFGAEIEDEQNNTVGYIAQGGQGFIRVKNVKGILKVSWGSDNSSSCNIPYDLSSITREYKEDLRYTNAICK